MTSISYSELFARYYLKVEAYDLMDSNITAETRVDFLCGFIHTALSDPYVRRLFSSIKIVDGNGEEPILTNDDIITPEEADDIFDSAKLQQESGVIGDVDTTIIEGGNDDTGYISYELKHTSDDVEADRDFVIEVIALGMVIAWIEPKVRSLTHMRRQVGTADEKWFSESSFLSTMQSFLEATQLFLQRIIRDRGFITNDYLNGNSASASLRG